MKTFAPLAFTAITGVVLWKLLATVLLPALGMLLGLLAMAVKFAVVAGVIFFIYSMMKKKREHAGV